VGTEGRLFCYRARAHYGRLPMTDYQFACPVCGQGIEINGPMREAILSNGCPVCSAAVDADAFECR